MKKNPNMKKLLFLGAIALTILCISCKKDNPSDYYKDVPELREEFDELVQRKETSGSLKGVSSFDTFDGGYVLKIEYFDEALGSPSNAFEGYFSIPFENVAPEKRIPHYLYYKFTPEDFVTGLAGFNTTASTRLNSAILRINTGDTPYHFEFVTLASDNMVYVFDIEADLEFPAKKVSLKQDFTFKSGEVETSAVFRHKPISGKNFDVLSVTVKTLEGKYPRYSTILHFVVNPVAKFQDALNSLPGDYYGISSPEDLGDHKIYGSIVAEENPYDFIGVNEWGETLVEEIVRPSNSQKLKIGPIYGDGTKFDISGTVDRYIYVFSSQKYNLNVASVTVNLADITEE